MTRFLLATTPVIMLPGIGNSGSGHWQTIWEQTHSNMTRFQPASWDAPNLEDWIDALDRAVAASGRPPLLIAHSLGCLLVVHWAARTPRPLIGGAFLVAVPDPDGASFPAEAAFSFRNVPDVVLPFPSLIAASADDPYGSPAYSRACAAAWGSGLVNVGRVGHINEASALESWPLGEMLFEAFKAGTS